MRALVQRVSSASVRVDGRVVGEIERGLLVLLGVRTGDGHEEVSRLVDKLVGLRIFPDETGAMQRALDEVAGAILLVSQFTLHADCRRGRRPSFIGAEEPARAESLYRAFAGQLHDRGVPVAEGVFGAHMEVALVNDGPVTLLLDTDELARPRRSSDAPTAPEAA